MGNSGYGYGGPGGGGSSGYSGGDGGGDGYSINGEIIITAVPTPLVITTGAAFGFTNVMFGFNVIGPSGSNVVIQASTDLQSWIPLQTNLLGSGLIYFSDSQSTTNVQRFYRAQLSP